MSTTDDNNEQQYGDSGEMTLNKEKCTSCEQSNVNNITEGIDRVVLDDKSICANCGKKGDDVNNVCNKCKMVKYCNAACKKKHRHKHKQECEEHIRLAAEQAAKLHDKELFKQPPSLYGDCPICFLRLPDLNSGWRYMSCCGKFICSGCFYSPVYDNQGNKVDKKCAFCRTPCTTSDAETDAGIFIMTVRRVKDGDAHAIYRLGVWYSTGGVYGLPQDHTKALELWYRAGELGYVHSYFNIGAAYHYGRGVEADKMKSIHYYELAAMGGDAVARHNLGNSENRSGNYDRALKHYMIATRDGNYESLDKMKEMYTNGNVTKEDYMKALQSYQEYSGEIKSDQRNKAAAADKEFRYY